MSYNSGDLIPSLSSHGKGLVSGFGNSLLSILFLYCLLPAPIVAQGSDAATKPSLPPPMEKSC